MDVETIRSLEEALLEFGGCALVVSHDRFFLDRICTHILSYEGNGIVRFFEGNFQIFHGCYTKEPFGYAIFDAIDNGKIPIIHTDWMKHIDYKYRASSRGEFHQKYLEIQEDGFEKLNLEFCKLRDGLTNYTNKQSWITKILEII